ncbi:protein yippee-like At4g27740 [Amaranthus tricolor]|uniref:protein yippee-like At4g27740 n=1 Tax=Amaranthus tricolor TaxID=29722 RepID=UPI0025851C9C|nr:protein yippee-like At4g27740 [Amaranthus tricolor]
MANLADHRVYSCNNCWNPIAFKDDILSKSFIASSGQAYMFRNATNLKIGDKFEKQLLIGHFTIAGIYYGKSGQVLGWKYIRAHDQRQAYKEGNYITIIIIIIIMYYKYVLQDKSTLFDWNWNCFLGLNQILGID